MGNKGKMANLSREERLVKVRQVKAADLKNPFWQTFAKNVMAEYLSMEFYTPDDLSASRQKLRAGVLELGEWFEKHLTVHHEALELSQEDIKKFVSGFTTGITVVDDNDKTIEDWRQNYSDLQDQIGAKEQANGELLALVESRDQSISELKTKVSELSNDLELKNAVSKIIYKGLDYVKFYFNYIQSITDLQKKLSAYEKETTTDDEVPRTPSRRSSRASSKSSLKSVQFTTDKSVVMSKAPQLKPEDVEDIFNMPIWAGFISFVHQYIVMDDEWAWLHHWWTTAKGNMQMGQATGFMQGPDLDALWVPKLGQVAANIMDEIFQNHLINISALTQEQLVIRLLVPLKNIMITLAFNHTPFFKTVSALITQLKSQITIPQLHKELNKLYAGLGQGQVECINYDATAWDPFKHSQLYYTDDSDTISLKPQVSWPPIRRRF